MRVYAWDGSTWVQQGADIDSEAAGDGSGWSVALSADGTTLAIGATGAGSFAGQVRVYAWDGSVWLQQGGDIDGEAGDQSGWSVALSADGTTLAIGAFGAGSFAGQVRVYGWDGSVWLQQGGDIDGEAVGDRVGYSVALSADGTTLAIGATGAGSSTGQVRVYGWDGSVWVQQGGDIDGEAAGDGSGWSVALSTDGTTLAIGAPSNDGAGGSAGHVRVYVADAPVLIGVPADITVEATAASGATVDYTTPTATDRVDDPDPDVVCDPASGATFPIATTTVTCTATDAAGNTTSAGFDVTVVDTTAPTLTGLPADIENVQATGPDGATVTFTAPTATDLVDPDPTVVCDPASGATFPIATTTVTCTATDAAGNSTSAGLDVEVLGEELPVVGAGSGQLALFALLLLTAGGLLLGRQHRTMGS